MSVGVVHACSSTLSLLLGPARDSTLRAPRRAARLVRTYGTSFASDAFPCFACGGGQPPSPSRFALGFLQSLARTLQLFFSNAYPLLGNLGLQPCALDGLSRRLRCIRGSCDPWRCFFAACLFHLQPESSAGRSGVSHMRGTDATVPDTRAHSVLQLRRVTYPQNMCISVWTAAGMRHKDVMQATTCVELLDLSPAPQPGAGDGSGSSARGCGKHRGRYPVASGVLAAV